MSKNIYFCKNCNKETKNPKFCSHSCSATYNNLNAPPTRKFGPRKSSKISKKRKKEYFVRASGPYTKVKWKNCSFCNAEFVSVEKNGHYGTLCNDRCYINSKHKNARGNKNLSYKGLKFDSKWEIELAMHMDMLGIQWIQPLPIIYHLNGKTKKYFPDFYLPDYDMYLDPKNKLVEVKQQSKILIVRDLIELRYGELDYLKDLVSNLHPII